MRNARLAYHLRRGWHVQSCTFSSSRKLADRVKRAAQSEDGGTTFKAREKDEYTPRRSLIGQILRTRNARNEDTSVQSQANLNQKPPSLSELSQALHTPTGSGIISNALPTSPIMRRYEKGPLPSKRQGRGVEAKRLMKNPWAKMLASPLRNCNVTQVRIPTDLLIEFSLVEDPKSSKTYLMPLKMADMEPLRKWKNKKSTIAVNGTGRDTKMLTSTEKPGTVVEGLDHKISETAESIENPGSGIDGSGEGTAREPKHLNKNQIPSVRILARKSTLQYATTAMSEKGSSNDAKVNAQLHPYRRFGQGKQKVYWSMSTPDLVTNLLQKRVVTSMENVLETGKDFFGKQLLIALDSSRMGEDLLGISTGAVLWMGSKKEVDQGLSAAIRVLYEGTQSLTNAESESQSSGNPPTSSLASKIPTMRIGSDTQVPVFNISALLGSTQHMLELEKLLCELLNVVHVPEWLLLRSSHAASVLAIEETWRLQSFVGHDYNLDEFLRFDSQRNPKLRRKDRRALADE